jgi:hypothetical protein
MRAITEAFNQVLALLVAVLLRGIDRGAGAVRASEHETDGAGWNDRNADAGCGGAFAVAIKILSTSEAIAYAALRGLRDAGDAPMASGGSVCSLIRASAWILHSRA